MASNQAPEPLNSIDNDLFHSYTRYQLCQLKKSTSLWTCNEEKEAMLNILDQFESIDGNTLRMVVNEIFEKSAVLHSSNEVSLSYQEASATSTHYLENFFSLPNTVSNKVSNSEATDRKWTTGAITSRKRPGRPPLAQKRPLAKKSKTQEPIVEKLKKFVANSNIKAALSELIDMANHVERSKYVILTRMRRVSTSFKLKVSSTTSQYSLHISTPFSDSRDPMNMCQSNLIAYQFGKLLEQKRFQDSNIRSYHAIREELLAHGQRAVTPASKYIRYAQNVVETADKIGAYALFIPEVVSPYGLQAISRQNFSILKSYLDVKCAVFKDIAFFDQQDNLILTEVGYSRKHGDKSYRQTASKLLNSST